MPRRLPTVVLALLLLPVGATPAGAAPAQAARSEQVTFYFGLERPEARARSRC